MKLKKQGDGKKIFRFGIGLDRGGSRRGNGSTSL